MEISTVFEWIFLKMVPEEEVGYGLNIFDTFEFPCSFEQFSRSFCWIFDSLDNFSWIFQKIIWSTHLVNTFCWLVAVWTNSGCRRGSLLPYHGAFTQDGCQPWGSPTPCDEFSSLLGLFFVFIFIFWKSLEKFDPKRIINQNTMVIHRDLIEPFLLIFNLEWIQEVKIR